MTTEKRKDPAVEHTANLVLKTNLLLIDEEFKSAIEAIKLVLSLLVIAEFYNLYAAMCIYFF